MTRTRGKPNRLKAVIQQFEDQIFDELQGKILAMSADELGAEFASLGRDMDKSALDARARLQPKPARNVPRQAQSSPMPGTVNAPPARANARIRDGVERLELGLASLASWGQLKTVPRLRMAAGATLASGAAVYSGFEAPLEKLFTAETLHEQAPWATGTLRLMFALSDDATIRSIKASVDTVEPAEHGASIVVSLRDGAGSISAIRLNREKPSAVVQNTPLKGAVEKLHLTVTLVEN